MLLLLRYFGDVSTPRMRVLVCCLAAYALPSPVHAGDSLGGLVPSTPPIHLHTADDSWSYRGAGGMRFTVALPRQAWPEFTLDEDGAYNMGDTNYTAYGLTYADAGVIGPQTSSESAWVAGVLKASLASSSFSHRAVPFESQLDQHGLFGGRRYAQASRLLQAGNLVVDWSYALLLSMYWLTGNVRIQDDTMDATYLSDWDERNLGLAARPMVALQPSFKIADLLLVIPYLGASAFMNLNYSSWTVGQWYDELYGQDCIDGCAESSLDVGFTPIELFFGFDIQFLLPGGDALSLSSLLSTKNPQEELSSFEVFLLYIWRVDEADEPPEPPQPPQTPNQSTMLLH